MSAVTDNPFVVLMLVLIIILGIAISLLANVLLSAAQYRAAEPEKEEEKPAAEVKPDKPGTPPALAGVAGAAVTGGALSSPAVNGISDTAFYLIVSIILLEVF